jgi:hypothetical protein
MPDLRTACNPKSWDWLTQSERDQNKGKKKLGNIDYDTGKYVRQSVWPHHRQEGEFKGGGSEKSQGGQWQYQMLAYSQIPKTTQKDKHKSPGGKVKTGGYKGQSDYMKPSTPSFSPSGYTGGSGFKKRWEVNDDKEMNYGSGDGMELKFETDDVSEIKFKIYLTGLSESHTPSWNGEPDQGRADARYLYESYERTVTLSFIVNGGDKCDDFGHVWKAIQELSKMTMPVYPDDKAFHGQIAKFTLGASAKGLFYQCPVLISSLSYDWDPSEGTWEIDKYMLPMRTSVDMELIVLGDQKSGREGGRIKAISDFQVYGKDLSSPESCDSGGGAGGGDGGGGAPGGGNGGLGGGETPLNPVTPPAGTDIPTGAPPGNTPADVPPIMTNSSPDTEPIDGGDLDEVTLIDTNPNPILDPPPTGGNGGDGGSPISPLDPYFGNGTPAPSEPGGPGDDFANDFVQQYGNADADGGYKPDKEGRGWFKRRDNEYPLPQNIYQQEADPKNVFQRIGNMFKKPHNVTGYGDSFGLFRRGAHNPIGFMNPYN